MTKRGGLGLLLICLLNACQLEPTVTATKTYAEPTDFEEATTVTLELAEGLKLDLWAPGPLLSNAVALSIDHQGVAYIAETSRRQSSDLDIRAHRNWITEDLALETLEDTRAFHLNKLSTERSDQNTWQEDFNQDGLHDYRDLMVQSERIRRIVDQDGDGRADYSQLYAEGFNEMLTGVAAGILKVEDAVYLTAAPDLWKLKDNNKDGVADERTSISHGYGIHIAYAGHDMSGLTLGLDGRIYWSIGDMGVNVVDATGKRWAYPHEGAVMRCELDGSNFEVFAHGVRNPQELAFDNYGNLISVDNDGDHRGEHERYIHILEGSDTGWRTHWQSGKYGRPNEAYKIWTDEKLHIPHFKGQAAYIVPPLALALDGPAGLAFNPGTALSSEWNNHFFVSYFTGSSANSRIQGFKLKPKGASFEVTESKDVVRGIVPTGLAFGPDGALYINDWKDSYSKKPEGRVWKLSSTDEKAIKLQQTTQKLLSEGMTNRVTKVVATFLAHADQRVRIAAQFELVKRKEGATLAAVANDSNVTLFGRLHAIWGIGQLSRKTPAEIDPIVSLLQDDKEQIRAQLAKIIGEAKYTGANELLLNQLQDTSAIAQYFAAEALGKIGVQEAFEPIVRQLEILEDQDVNLRHGFIYALKNLDDADKLAALAQHPSTYVKLAAVVALRKLKSPKVTTFLQDDDPLILIETARAIHDDRSIPTALPALAKALNTTNIEEEAFLRRAINANLRLGDATSASRLCAFIQSSTAPEVMQQDALWALGYWGNPPVLDRVEGNYRKLDGHQLTDTHRYFAAIDYKKLSPTLKVAWVEAVGRLQYQVAHDQILDYFNTPNQPLAIRSAALTSLSQLQSKELAQVISLALSDKAPSLREKAQALLTKADLPETTLINLLEKIIKTNPIREKQKAIRSLAELNSEAATTVLEKLISKLNDQSLASALQLDVIEAAEAIDKPQLQTALKTYRTTLDSTNELSLYSAALYGGDLNQGQHIFSQNTTAQCLRCHALGGNGGAVGPPLDKIGSQLSREDLLLSLVAPSARIAPGYGTVSLTLQDSTTLTGILLAETQTSLQLKVGEEKVKTIDKTIIQERENMPSGMFNMAQMLELSQIRDLVAYLTSLQ